MGAARDGCTNQIRELDGRHSPARACFPGHPQGPHSRRMHLLRRATRACRRSETHGNQAFAIQSSRARRRFGGIGSRHGGEPAPAGRPQNAGPHALEQNLFSGVRHAQARPPRVLLPHGGPYSALLEGPALGHAALPERNRRKKFLPKGSAGIHSRLDQAGHRLFRRARWRNGLCNGRRPRFPSLPTNLRCIDHHPLSSRFNHQDYPDYVFFDLDPTPDTPFSTVLRVARSIYNVLLSTRLVCFLKTSGATGFHIFVPLDPIYKYAQTRTFAEIISQLVATELPRDTTLERSIRKRPPGRVLLDALQNAKGKPLAAVYSARAHPGANVSTPVTADELMNGNIDPDAWTIKTITSRLEAVGDLWKDFWKKRQSLDAALEALSRRLSGEKQES